MERRFKFVVKFINGGVLDVMELHCTVKSLKRVKARVFKRATRRVIEDTRVERARIWLDGKEIDVLTPVHDDDNNRLNIVRSLIQDGFIHRDELIKKKKELL